MWRSGGSNWFRRLSAAARRYADDEGDWLYSSEWWGTDYDCGHSVLQSNSGKGNGVVSVVAHPSSKPSRMHWPSVERWLQQRWEQVHVGYGDGGNLRVLGYEWRVLRFNHVTRQSTAKVMAVYNEDKPESVYLIQQPHCLAVPYLKIEIDPLVISASIQAMGFPAFSLMTQSGYRAFTKPDVINEVMWKGTHERLYLYEADAEEFITKSNNLYDMIFIDAYDGDDIFPHKFWNPDLPFLKALSSRLHPKHGTVVVNLHSDSDVLNNVGSFPSELELVLPMGKYVYQVCRAYKDVVLGTGNSGKEKGGHGLAFTVAVPWVCNTSLVVCRGFSLDSEYINRNLIVNALISKSLELEHVLDLPFPCLEYLKKGFVLVE